MRIRNGCQMAVYRGRERLRRPAVKWMLWATVLAPICGGCPGPAGVSTRTKLPGAPPVVKDASREELLHKYNQMAKGVNSVNATAELRPTAGSKYSGFIEEYHEVKAFLLAERPAAMRMIGQAPVIGTTIFDMASDGETFRVYIPSKNKFLVGPVSAERGSGKPIENLRPQHLLDALLWPEVRKEEPVVLEEFNDDSGRYYVLTVLRGGYRTEILRKIWFNRSDLLVFRLQGYGPKGVLLSDIRESNWQPLTGDQPSPPAGGSNSVTEFPRSIRIERPHDDYRLDMDITKLSVNQEIPQERFTLAQPAGSEPVHLSQGPENQQP